MHIYLDESGSLNKNNGSFFIVGSYTVGNSKRIVNAFRRFQRTKFPRKLKYQSEIKFNNSDIDDKIRIKMIKYLAKQDIRIFYSYLAIKNVPEQYREKKGTFKTGVLYTHIISSTLELYLPSTELEFRVFRDQRPLKGVTLNEFNEHLNLSLLPKLPVKTKLQVQALNSVNSPEIQVADWVCGALARYHENKPLGEEFYKSLKNNIVASKELFERYWEEKWNKKQ